MVDMAFIDNQSPADIEHPYRSGLIASVGSVDELAGMLQSVKVEIDRLRATEYALRNAIAGLATAETKTKRVAGERFFCKVTMPDDSWEQATLKRLWADSPNLATVYLRIASLAPNLTEVKKLTNTSGNQDLEKFKSQLLSARRPANSPPSISIEPRE